MSKVEMLARNDGETIAYLKQEGASPGIVWLGGFHSDMAGTKAETLSEWAKVCGQSYLRFDYFGHGLSSGDFRNGTISRWRDDALAVIGQLCSGPQILVGSSMGAWIALLAARVRPDVVKGLLLLAPAPDFTEDLMWAEMPAEVRREIMDEGAWLRPSDYGDAPYPITRGLIEDGRRNLVLGAPIALSLPVRIIQGMADPDVPWRHALRLVERLDGNPELTLVKHGDHRLSTPADLARMTRVLEDLLRVI